LGKIRENQKHERRESLEDRLEQVEKKKKGEIKSKEQEELQRNLP